VSRRLAEQRESFASYFGRKADKAIEAQRNAADAQRKSDEDMRTMVARRQQKGVRDAEISEDLNCTVEEFLKRYPVQS
jgi:hypothetical protein